MISLHVVPAGELDRLSGLMMNAGPQFASSGAVAIQDRTPDLTFHEIRAEGRTVGMFKLDPRYHERHDFAKADEIGLRGVLIDRDHQGKGYGLAAVRLLPDHVKITHPLARAVLLTVNIKNGGAYRTYQRAGFVDTDERYLGGDLGPQHIMRLSLDHA
ncbi:GNAT family N-acetyltransferase [Paracoccus sp. TK19116]|uniref:GNAT family N-acetyltransferase n=1 Tax=Paracoccus albicereus TaxID=2922394 RepID=A0ABT1MXQ1_9RHOB|nr:GNAT family N-acetyltransferase [Paracoccus albicereus]MCQ0971656.1 GNAT family N-acetyltransferase [Paracoccus albicereus]